MAGDGPRARRPGILLFALDAGFGGMHMPRHLDAAGFDVTFAGHPKSLAGHSGRLMAKFDLKLEQGKVPLDPLLQAAERHRPHWIVPLDEFALGVLQRALESSTGPRALPRSFVALLSRSLGPLPAAGPGRLRAACHEIATRAGIRVPAQVNAPDSSQALAFAREHGYPVLLKRERSSGGTGVMRVPDEAAMRSTRIQSLVEKERESHVLQSHVEGKLGMHAVVAADGKVLAGVSALQERTRTDSPFAPSSVVLVQLHAGMAAAAAAFVEASGASGFLGWDFILAKDSGNPVLIEYNARPITITHLGGLIGRDLCRALRSHLDSGAHQVEAPATSTARVAVFPDEWLRDPGSADLHGSFHDVPWDDPDLLRAFFRTEVRFVSPDNRETKNRA